MAERQAERQYNLDWIRVCVVLILIPFHAAVSFSHIGKGYVYTNEPVFSWLYIFISDYFNLWIMRMLFFISGISTFMAFRKRSLKDFTIERVKRLILPVIFLLLSIGPVSGYILAVGRYGFTGSFPAFYPQFFLHLKKYLFWGHMWYCVYLFIFSIVTLPLFSYFLNRPYLARKINGFLIKKNNILLPMLIIIFFECLLRPFYPGYQSFIGDWANVAVHLSFYVMGFILGQNIELFSVISGKIKVFLITALSSTIVYLYLKRFLFTGEGYIHLLILSFLWGAAAYCWVMFFIGLSGKYWNRQTPLLKYLSNSSFSLYLFHYLILSALNYFLLKSGLNHYLIWGATVIGTYLIFVILFELVLKRIKPLRYICGIRN